MMNTNHVKQFLVQNIMSMDQSDTVSTAVYAVETVSGEKRALALFFLG